MFNIFKRQFPKKIKGVWIQGEYYEKEKSKYCVDMWEDVSWNMGQIIPMIQNENKIAYYELTNYYYPNGTSSMSDWGMADGHEYDFKFHHVEKSK